MPNTKSAKRKVKKVAKQVLINKFWKRRYKLAIKKMETLLKKPKNKKEILGFHSEFQSELMKAAKNGVVKKKSASRKIARVSKKIKNLKS
jgi:small subunit ribosomal protein S20|tara:strand:- start:39 stop:308 length:270 start_codon:yes stop_codon:yes gene_type:complete